MGRYVSTGTSQANSCQLAVSTTCYQSNTQKYSYSSNDCWQNRVILDTPGNYSFTVPSGITCLRVVSVGGGGKPKCTETCCGYAGGGGGYAERYDTVSPGCVVSVVVGRQEQDTTISYTNSSAVARTVTGGGAAGCTPGAASGGDWNSIGGTGGKGCNYCGGSLSHYCGTCICFSLTTCCGYCIVVAGVGIGQTPGHGSDQCCNARYPGGASAGWWGHLCGGNGQGAQNSVDIYGASGGHGATAGGGGGVGYTFRQDVRSGPCSCMCGSANQGGQGGPHQRNACFPNSAGGGGGTKWQICTCCECQNMYNTNCTCGFWIEGHGGWGGYDNHSGVGGCIDWDCIGFYCGNYASCTMYTPPSKDPIVHSWHDIHSMCGSGSAGRSHHRDNDYWCGSILWATREDQTTRPANAGEGAGTGGVVFVCCATQFHYNNNSLYVNWPFVCCLGLTGKVCCSDRFAQSLFPNIISCAGTLGGSGGVGICTMMSKAGKGGGGGVFRNYILCVCYGNSTFNTCNGDGVTALAYPACELDWRISNAGTGMAIIYWKDA
jgi:hypothetical protein